MNIARKLPSDKHVAVDKQTSVFEETTRVIISLVLDFNETIMFNPIKEADNKQTDVNIVTRKEKKHSVKKQIKGSNKL